MNWLTALETIVGGALSGSAGVFGLSRYLGDRWLERLKAQYSKELAQFSHERSILLTEIQNAFSMGATSHMATTAFDKHIGFCQEYVDAISKALDFLNEAGPEKRLLDTSEFFRIRQKWALWLTDEIESNLDRFEFTISTIAAGAPVTDDNGPLSNERSAKTLIAFLRELLATEQLTALRNELVLRALRRSPPAVESV